MKNLRRSPEKILQPMKVHTTYVSIILVNITNGTQVCLNKNNVNLFSFTDVVIKFHNADFCWNKNESKILKR